MKKRWIPFILACLVAVFITGIRLGSAAEVDLQQDRQATQARLNTIIAVVNADVGEYINGARYNYSAAIIDNLGDDFILVSPAMAQTGFANGTYAAIVTFPPDASSRILSFNAVEPERINLEFQINESLSERDYLETFMNILGLQHSINTTLANTYVSSILRQFHDAQDQVDGIFQNNISDLMALELITLGDFTATLQLDEVPYIPLNPRELDRQFYMEQVASFASEVAGWYLNSFNMAADQYLWMREGLFSLTENFPEQEDHWLEMLDRWTNYSVEYGELLEIFSAYVEAHDRALEAWHMANLTWNTELANYQRQVADWHGVSNVWFDGAEIWYSDYMRYLGQVVEYMEALTNYRIELENSLSPVIYDMTAWLLYLQDYQYSLYVLFTSFLDYVDEYNIQIGTTNEFLGALLSWRISLEDWNEVATQRVSNLSNWQQILEEAQVEVQFIFDLFEEHLDLLPDMPDLNDPEIDLVALLYEIIPPYMPDDKFAPPPSLETPPTIPQVPPAVAAFTGSTTTSGAAIQTTFFSSGLIDEENLRQWHDNLVNTSSETIGWHTSTQTSVDEIIIWKNELLEFYEEVYEWYRALEDFADVSYQRSNEVMTLYLFFNEFFEELSTVEFPELPSLEYLEYLGLFDDLGVYIPDVVDPIPQIELDFWDEDLIAPSPYNGAQIAEAFTQEFPLDGAAISEVMGLERAAEFTDYNVPYIVEEQPFNNAMTPFNPLVGAPPRPDDFWRSLDQMHGQLSSFEIGNFLSYDIHQRVEGSLRSYDMFLDTVREDINFMFDDNIWLMHDVHAQHNFFLGNLRHDAFSANISEQQTLQEAVDGFADIVEGNSENNRERLGTFASMIPESRAIGGVNQNLVSFAVSPFDFTAMDVRDEMPTANLLVEPMAVRYQRHQNIILMVTGAVFGLTLICSAISYFRKKKRVDEV